MENRLLTINDFTAKDVFNILHVCKNKGLIDYITTKIEQICSGFIPEEVVILNTLISKH